MAAINSADEAAAWAHRNLPAKNALTAPDAKIVEERFQARLSKIRDGETSEGSRRGTSDDWRSPCRIRTKKVRAHSGNNPEGTWSMLWANRFGFAIRSTVGTYSDSLALCAAACHRIRITSHSHSRVQWDDA
jgi:hypothetical protein